jgi:poly(A) polymerase
MQISPAWLHWPETQTLIKAFAEAPVRFVGGSVRDALLGREVQDVDAATPLLPQEVMELLRKAGIKAIPTGIDHGTVTAIVGSHQFEITTLRLDVATDGRRATVAYTKDWKEDAARRDFTMNALYCDRQGELYDYFGGADDAAAGHVRFIGDAATRIAEDALRILRFFRFFAHYGKGEIDAEGIQACAASAEKINGLSGERIEQEMMKLLVADRAGELVELMQRHDIWSYIIPQAVKTGALSALPGVMHSAVLPPDALLALAALLRSVGDNASALIDAIDTRWKLSKADYRRLQALCKPLIASVKWADERAKKKHLRALGGELFIDQVLLLMAEGGDALSGLKAIEFARSWPVPEFPLTGNDLLAVGFVPGKKLGAHLAMLESYWEDQEYNLTKEELIRRLSVK